jgi:hypothetical protein
MTNEDWQAFFRTCARVLGAGARQAAQSRSWCAWTTFGSLSESVHYWAAGLPAAADLAPVGTADGGVWGQPFLYQDLAHVVIPREFYWETVEPGRFENGTREQDIGALSRELTVAGIEHRLTELVLEVKLY